MLEILFKSSKSPREVVNGARAFFLREGLKQAHKNDLSIRLQNGIGYVVVKVTHQGEVSITTQGWEHQAKQFAESYR